MGALTGLHKSVCALLGFQHVFQVEDLTMLPMIVMAALLFTLVFYVIIMLISVGR